MSVAAKSADPKGLKRVCVACGIRFYDMNKRPICCPNCSTEFTGEIKVKGRRSRIVADEVVEKKGKVAETAQDEDEDLLPEDGDVVSLEELDEDGDEDDDLEVVGDLDDGDLEGVEDMEDDLEDLDGDIEVEQDEDENS